MRFSPGPHEALLTHEPAAIQRTVRQVVGLRSKIWVTVKRVTVGAWGGWNLPIRKRGLLTQAPSINPQASQCTRHWVSRQPALESSKQHHVMKQEALSMRKLSITVFSARGRCSQIMLQRPCFIISNEQNELDFLVHHNDFCAPSPRVTDQWETLEDLNQAVW